jgi:A/G-specific adenine glycosylase
VTTVASLHLDPPTPLERAIIDRSGLELASSEHAPSVDETMAPLGRTVPRMVRARLARAAKSLRASGRQQGSRTTTLPRPDTGPDTAALLAWYDVERRELPWRYSPGVKADAYRVWLSEVMLQQTVVKAVIPYFEAFTVRWPTVRDLAAAKLDDVLAAWAGLGYYSRARNLHACAQAVVADHGGKFPRDETKLRELPGIGPYTAAAIASIGHGLKATPVDGNIERVVSRLFAIETPLPGAKRELKRLAETITPDKRSGDYAQAMMDLGATICTPRRPSCLMCPYNRTCEANARGIQATLPVKAAKAERPVRYGVAFIALREDGQVLIRQRPEQGLLALMMEVPSSEWLDDAPQVDAALRAAPVRADWWQVPGGVTHIFTHFRLELTVYRAVVSSECELTFWADAARCRWVPRRNLATQALPSVMRKIIAHALKEM